LICRWQRDHSAELHTAWMNGSGLLVWENVFGTWVGWNARDRSRLRSMLPIQRRYTGLFTASEWTPLVETGAPDVYASLWQRNGLRLWTLVNRREAPAEGRLLSVPHAAGTQYFDLLGELMGDPDPEKSKRVTDAMLKMQKIIVADLQKAYDG
jgi:hypothetical protein